MLYSVTTLLSNPTRNSYLFSRYVAVLGWFGRFIPSARHSCSSLKQYSVKSNVPRATNVQHVCPKANMLDISSARVLSCVASSEKSYLVAIVQQDEPCPDNEILYYSR